MSNELILQYRLLPFGNFICYQTTYIHRTFKSKWQYKYHSKINYDFDSYFFKLFVRCGNETLINNETLGALNNSEYEFHIGMNYNNAVKAIVPNHLSITEWMKVMHSGIFDLVDKCYPGIIIVENNGFYTNISGDVKTL